jgi:hypothetical protein
MRRTFLMFIVLIRDKASSFYTMNVHSLFHKMFIAKAYTYLGSFFYYIFLDNPLIHPVI